MSEDKRSDDSEYPKYQFAWIDPTEYNVSDMIEWYIEHGYSIMESWLDRVMGSRTQILILWGRNVKSNTT